MAKKKKKAEITLSDFGTAECKAKAVSICFERTDKRLGGPKLMRITMQTPSDRYYQRGQISRGQFEAGEKLYDLWRRTGRSPRLVLNYDAVIVDGSTPTHTQGEPFSYYIAILHKLGQDMGKVAIWICCEGINPNDAATQLNHDPRAGITLPRITLDGLGDIFCNSPLVSALSAFINFTAGFVLHLPLLLRSALS